MEGKITSWYPEYLYGFIQPADMSDRVYVHMKEILSNGPVKEGSRALFEVKNTENGREAKSVKLLNSDSPSLSERRLKGRVTSGNDQIGLWFIGPYDKSPDVAVHHTQLTPDTEGFLIVGDEVEFSVEERNSKLAATKVVVTSFASQTRDPLFGFADMGRGPWLEKLAEISEEEPWGYVSTQSNDGLPVLRSYLKFTFMRLRETDGGVRESKNGAWASFNTGLVTPNQNEIYALFLASKKPSRRQWRFQHYTTLEDRNFVDLFGGEPPPLAEYYSDPSVLFYDKKLPLHINATHMMDNIERFPEELRNNHHLAKLALEAQQASIEKRVHRNYKTAIPQFFRDKGGMGEIQLLLPLCLVNQRIADLALVVEKTESGDAYRGSTVLTLDMAYNNARLLVRPDSQWLKP